MSGFKFKKKIILLDKNIYKENRISISMHKIFLASIIDKDKIQ